MWIVGRFVAFLRIVAVEVTNVNMSCSRKGVWSFRTWKLIGCLPSFLPYNVLFFLLFLLDVLFVPVSLSLSLSHYFLVLLLYYFPFFPIFVFFSPPFKSFIFLCFISPPSLRISYCLLFLNFIFFCSSFLFLSPHLPPPPTHFIYFRYSSANECVKFPANRERKLRITSVWTPSSYQALSGEAVDHKTAV